ncbi:Galactoside 2-alpha-L-fucosyltransferase 2 [Lamellibrachia satsuma]|nr:Galactoside 2-alpha-L-fucosyltransferase 2 [Lamellibrachia satsuma]
MLVIGCCALFAGLLYYNVDMLRMPWYQNIPNASKTNKRRPSTTKASESSMFRQRNLNVSICYFSGARLGNQMFQLASLYAIARQNDRHVQLPSEFKHQLKVVFPRVRPMASVKRRVVKTYRRLHEKGFAMYDDKLSHLPQEDIQISGYLQSWRYFAAYEKEIHALLEFNPEVVEAASRFFKKLEHMLAPSHVTFIGIHVRRGDIVNRPWLNMPGRKYIANAMTHFRRQFPYVHFVVCSDDATWCEENIGRLSNVTVSKSNSPEVDLAILAGCHHSVMTVGTFGWWAAWLTGGQVVYYPNPSVAGSSRANHFKKEDYFPTHWTPVSE